MCLLSQFRTWLESIVEEWVGFFCLFFTLFATAVYISSAAGFHYFVEYLVECSKGYKYIYSIISEYWGFIYDTLSCLHKAAIAFFVTIYLVDYLVFILYAKKARVINED